jgi:hypothetical protein
VISSEAGWQVRAARSALLGNKEWQKFNLMSVFGSSPAIRQQLELTVRPPARPTLQYGASNQLPTPHNLALSPHYLHPRVLQPPVALGCFACMPPTPLPPQPHPQPFESRECH